MEVQNHSHTGEKVVWTRCIVKAVDPVHGEIQMVTWGQGNFIPGQWLFGDGEYKDLADWISGGYTGPPEVLPDHIRL